VIPTYEGFIEESKAKSTAHDLDRTAYLLQTLAIDTNPVNPYAFWLYRDN